MHDSNPSPSERSADFLLKTKRPPSHEFLVLAGMLACLVVFRFQALRHINSLFLGGSEGDAGLYIWLVQSNVRDLFTLPWFNTQAFYPYTQSLAWSDNFILPALLAKPLLWLGLSLPLSYNLLLLLAYVLNGYATYHLCVKLTGKPFAAFVMGVLFMNYSTLTGNLGHPQLQFIFWLPLCISALYDFFAAPRLAAALRIGFLLFLSFLCTVYYTLFSAIAVIALIGCTLLLRPRQFTRRDLALLGSGIALGALPALPFVLPYLSVRSVFGEREIYEAYYFSASALSYLSAGPLSFLYKGTAPWSHAEANLFPGFAVLVLVVAAFPRLWSAKPLKNLSRVGGLLFLGALACTSGYFSEAWIKLLAAALLWACLGILLLLTFRMGLLERKLGFNIMTNRGLTASFLLLAFVFFAMSLGPLGNPEKGQWALGVYRLFYELFPGFNAIRAIGRAGIPCVFFLCVVGALSLATFQDKKRRVAAPLLSMVLGLGLLENYVPQYPLDAQNQPPPAVDFLAGLPNDDRGAIIALPLVTELSNDGTVKSWSEFARLNTQYMQWLFPANLPTVNGYSGQRTKLMRELPAQTLDFPDQRSVNALRSIVGLRYVLYASSKDPGFLQSEFDQRVKNLPGNLTLKMSDTAGNYLFELSGSSRVRTDTYLLAPSFPAGVVYVELMSIYKKDAAEVEVDIYAMNYSQTSPIATAKVKQNGEWERFLIKLPEVEDPVRPDWLTFRIKDDVSVFFRESNYKLKPD